MLIIDILLYFILSKLHIDLWLQSSSIQVQQNILLSLYRQFMWFPMNFIKTSYPYFIQFTIYSNQITFFIQLRHRWSHTNFTIIWSGWIRFYLFFGKCNAICSQYFLIFTRRLKFYVELSKASNKCVLYEGTRNNVYGMKLLYCQCIA